MHPLFTWWFIRLEIWMNEWMTFLIFLKRSNFLGTFTLLWVMFHLIRSFHNRGRCFILCCTPLSVNIKIAARWRDPSAMVCYVPLKTVFCARNCGAYLLRVHAQTYKQSGRLHDAGLFKNCLFFTLIHLPL